MPNVKIDLPAEIKMKAIFERHGVPLSTTMQSELLGLLTDPEAHAPVKLKMPTRPNREQLERYQDE